MIELSLKDRLQPALLDRLTDDERLLTVFRLTPDAVRMRECQLTVQDVDRVLTAHGLRRSRPDAGSGPAGDPKVLEYVVVGRSVSPASLRALRLRGSPGTPEVALQACCQVEGSTAVNRQLEVGERRAISMRRLREAVLRDLGWLLNASGIDDVVDLGRYPEVRRSVVNFGLRSQAGRAISSIDPLALAARIRDAVAFFEPRLSDVRVTPEPARDETGGMSLSFLVEAELWGQPVAQHLSLRTSVDIDSGDVRVTDQAARP